MASRKSPRTRPARRRAANARSRSERRRPRAAKTQGFVGRAGSPVLDHYPPKPMDAPVGTPVPPPAAAAAPAVAPPRLPTSAPSTPSTAPAVPPKGAGGPPKPLISLEAPFDIDEFSQLLGQTQVRVTVPRESLSEVLRRVCDFMGFGIYVYTIRVRPGPEELLKTFIVELQRVDFSAPDRDWAPFQDRGKADSPFGPTGVR